MQLLALVATNIMFCNELLSVVILSCFWKGQKDHYRVHLYDYGLYANVRGIDKDCESDECFETYSS